MAVIEQNNNYACELYFQLIECLMWHSCMFIIQHFSFFLFQGCIRTSKKEKSGAFLYAVLQGKGLLHLQVMSQFCNLLTILTPSLDCVICKLAQEIEEAVKVTELTMHLKMKDNQRTTNPRLRLICLRQPKKYFETCF